MRHERGDVRSRRRMKRRMRLETTVEEGGKSDSYKCTQADRSEWSWKVVQVVPKVVPHKVESFSQ